MLGWLQRIRSYVNPSRALEQPGLDGSTELLPPEYLSLLELDEDFWPVCPSGLIKIHRVETPNFWEGYHETYGPFSGTTTHYDALPSAERTARGFRDVWVTDPKTGKKKRIRSASSHAVIARKSSDGKAFADLYVLARWNVRTWHAGFNLSKGDKVFTLPNGIRCTNPNHHFLGLDLSNWGYLKKKGRKYYAWPKDWGIEVPSSKVLHSDGRYWEIYTPEALMTYKAVMALAIKGISSLYKIVFKKRNRRK